jgi:hypothetical protein
MPAKESAKRKPKAKAKVASKSTMDMRPLEKEAKRLLLEKQQADEAAKVRQGEKEDERWFAKHQAKKADLAKRQQFLECAWTGNVAGMKKHLKGRNRVHVDCTDDEGTGMTALHLACNKKQREVVEFLLDSRASINITNAWGWTPVMFAANNEDLISVKKLVEKGAEADRAPAGGKYDCCSPLWRSLDKGFFDMAEYLFSIGCKVSEEMTETHNLFIKAKYGTKFDGEKDANDGPVVSERKAKRAAKARRENYDRLRAQQVAKDEEKKAAKEKK